LKGLDDIGLVMQYKKEIKAFEARHRKAMPWLA
jgi:3-isopropylmalate dehydratase small subunit